MKLACLLLLMASMAQARPPSAPPHRHRARPSAAQPPPEPEPPPEADQPDDQPGGLSGTVDEPAEQPTAEQAPAPDDSADAPAGPSPGAATKTSDDELTDEQAGLIGLASMCCCLVMAGGVVALIVWLVTRGKKSQGPSQAAAPPAAAPPRASLQLSVMALGLDAGAAAQLQQQLAAEGLSLTPATPVERSRLVRVLSARLQQTESGWAYFGYGEHVDLADLAAAERSYRLASEDFRARALKPPDAVLGSGWQVVCLVLCTSRQVLGVSRLDERAQVRSMLDDRGRLADAELLGADLVWSATLSEGELLSRFPEMHALAA